MKLRYSLADMMRATMAAVITLPVILAGSQPPAAAALFDKFFAAETAADFAGIGAEDRQKILCKNTAELYGFELV